VRSGRAAAAAAAKQSQWGAYEYPEGLHTPPSGASSSDSARSPSSPPACCCNPSKKRVEPIGGPTGVSLTLSRGLLGVSASSSTIVKVCFTIGKPAHCEPSEKWTPEILGAPLASEVKPASFVSGERLKRRTLASPLAGGTYDAAIVST
jgi:hypothetical protein